MECSTCCGIGVVTCPICHGSSVDRDRGGLWETCERCLSTGDVGCPEPFCRNGIIGGEVR